MPHNLRMHLTVYSGLRPLPPTGDAGRLMNEIMRTVPYKEILSASAIALTFATFVHCIRVILGGKTKPHVFLWVIWG